MVRNIPQSNSCYAQRLLLIGCLLLAATAGCGTNATEKQVDAAPAETKPPSDKIAVVYYQHDDPFSEAVRAGAEAAAEEFKRELEWHLPPDEAEAQASRFKQAISDKVAGICICPVDPISQMDIADEAAAAGIPVAIFERPMAEGPRLVTFAGTDHFHCGKVLIESITEGKKNNKVLVLRHKEDHMGAIQRQQGFETTAKDTEELELILSDGQVASIEGSKVDEVKTWIEEIEDLTAVATLTASDAAIAVEAVEQLDMLDKINIYGFGATEQTRRLLEDKKLTATVLEDPYMMGYSAIMAMVNHLEASSDADPMNDLIVTGEHFVDAETINTDRNQRLLQSNPRTGIEN